MGGWGDKMIYIDIGVNFIDELFQEIYGVERKGADEVMDDEIDDTGKLYTRRK